MAGERVKLEVKPREGRGSADTRRLRAEGMEYSHLDRLIQFNGRMRASFPPQATP